MFHQRLLLYVITTHMLDLLAESAAFNRLSADSIDPVALTTFDNEDGWQPISHRKWIYLQSAPGNTNELNPHTLSYHQIKHKLAPPQHMTEPRHPVNYYAHNRSSSNSGNYQPPNEGMRILKPYVLTAISNMRRGNQHQQQQGNTQKVRQKTPSPLANNPSHGGTFTPKDVIKPDDQQQNIQDERASAHEPVNGDEEEDNDSNAGVDFEEADDEQFNEILLPLRSALEKVKIFCDVAKHFLSAADDEDIATGDRNRPAKQPADTEGRKIQGPTIPPHNPVHPFPKPPTSNTDASIVSGRKLKKKLKKKLGKIVLPLLIAYKLKFLTLIPVLIGGLTLLVGSTGLAGFFFALFTAVMSLRPIGGGKSIVVKKLDFDKLI